MTAAILAAMMLASAAGIAAARGLAAPERRLAVPLFLLGGREYAVVGLGDIAILAAAFVAFGRETGAEWEPAAWLVGGLTAAFIAGLWLGGAPGIPFIAAGCFALLHSRRADPVR